jgi:hypothetical protein
VIDLLLLAGVAAAIALVVIGVVYVLIQRRQGTVRAVLMPRRKRDGPTDT